MQVDRLIVGCAGLPATVHDADPLVGQGSQGGLVRASLGALALVIGAGPERARDRAAGPFDEGLAQEGRAGEAPMDPALVAAALQYGCNARVLLELGGTGVALALFAKGDEQAGREDRAGTGQRCEQRIVG